MKWKKKDVKMGWTDKVPNNNVLNRPIKEDESGNIDNTNNGDGLSISDAL